MKALHSRWFSLLVLFFLAACQSVKAAAINPTPSDQPASASTTATRTPFQPLPTSTPSLTPTLTHTPTPLPPTLTPTTSPTPLYRGEQVLDAYGVLVRFTTDQDWIVLTIDDGLVASAAINMLDQLKAAGVHATFFIAGKCARYNLGPEIMQRMASEGHEIAYHSMEHPALNVVQAWTITDWEQDYADWQAALRDSLGDDLYAKAVSPYARAPYGLFTDAFLQLCANHALQPVFWSCDPTCVDGTLPLRAGRIIIYHVRTEQEDSLKQLLSLGRPILSLGEAINSR